MKNEIQVKPLIEYEVYLRDFDNDANDLCEVFTADGYEVVDNVRTVFYRTGNVVREYQRHVDRIVATPVDPNQIPQ